MVDQKTRHIFEAHYKEVNGGLNRAIDLVDQYGNRLTNLNEKTEASTDKTKKQANAFNNINFEFLGVMFFGQRVAQTFKGMLGPASRLLGIHELLGTVLEVTFLPIMQKILPLFLKLSDHFLSLDENARLVIGGFVGFFAVAFSLVGVIGQLVLGYQSISIAMNTAKGAMTTVNSVGNKTLGIFKNLAGIGLVAVGVTLAVSSLQQEGIQIWKDIGSAIAGALGLKFLTGASTLTTLKYGGSLLALSFGLDMVFDAANTEGTQIYESVIGGLLTGFGLAGLAAVLLGVPFVGTAAIVVPIAVTMAVTLDWFISDREGEIPEELRGAAQGRRTRTSADFTQQSSLMVPEGMGMQISPTQMSTMNQRMLQSPLAQGDTGGANASRVVINQNNVFNNSSDTNATRRMINRANRDIEEEVSRRTTVYG